MPAKLSREQTLAAELAKAKVPRLLHLHTDILLHRPSQGGGVCPCCGSEFAEIDESWPDLDLVIDVRTGDRLLRGPGAEKGFDKIAKRATRVDIPLRCYRQQLDGILDDTHKVIIAFCGNRAGKTEGACVRCVRRWMLRGGRDVDFGLISPSLKQTQIWVDKLIRGARPILPQGEDGRSFLVQSFPEKHTDTDQAIRMVDGSRFHLVHAAYTGTNLRGFRWADAFFDEVTAVRHASNWTIGLARLIDLDGTMYASTTPAKKVDHWFHDIYARAELEASLGDAPGQAVGA